MSGSRRRPELSCTPIVSPRRISDRNSQLPRDLADARASERPSTRAALSDPARRTALGQHIFTLIASYAHHQTHSRLDPIVACAHAIIHTSPAEGNHPYKGEPQRRAKSRACLQPRRHKSDRRIVRPCRSPHWPNSVRCASSRPRAPYATSRSPALT